MRMNASRFWRRAGRIWAQGLLLFGLRLAQLRTGFDPETGLSVPNLPGKLLAACLVLCAVLEAVLCLRLPKEKGSYACQFAPPEGETSLLVLGCLLLFAGGVLTGVPAALARDAAGIAAGVLALASGGGFLLLAKKVRAGEPPALAPALPSLFFGVAFVLTVYLPSGSDPVLARFYVPVLAAAMTAYAFSRLADFLKREGHARSFVFTADLAVMLCLAAIAGGGAGRRLLFAGCAAALTVFLLLRRDEPLPEPEEAGPEEGAPEEAAS